MALLNNPNPVPGFIGGAAITKHDSNPNEFRAIYVGGAGNIKITGRNGEVFTLIGVPVGSILPIATSVIWSTDTTATNMVGLR